MESINERRQNDYYTSPKCNELNATDGFRFPISSIRKSQKLETYGQDICRKLFYEFGSEIQNDRNLTLWRYILNPNNFAHPSSNSENSCYCDSDGSSCSPSGFFSLSRCQNGTPLFLSWPHQYGAVRAGQILRDDSVATYFDVDPVTGNVYKSVKNFQINIGLTKVEIGSNNILGNT